MSVALNHLLSDLAEGGALMGTIMQDALGRASREREEEEVSVGVAGRTVTLMSEW